MYITYAPKAKAWESDLLAGCPNIAMIIIADDGYHESMKIAERVK